MSYQPTQVKLTAAPRDSLISEVYVFRQLDTLKPTATGLDGIPAWFLRLGAPIFAAPLARLFNQTIMEGTVPQRCNYPTVSTIGCETFSPTEIIARDMLASCRLSPLSKPA